MHASQLEKVFLTPSASPSMLLCLASKASGAASAADIGGGIIL